MKIDYLLKLKKLAITTGMVAGLWMLTGCGEEEPLAMESNSISQTKDNEEKNNSSFVQHEHLVIEIGGQTIIFRECDGEIKSVSTDWVTSTMHGYLKWYSYEVKDKDGNIIIEGNTNAKWSIEKIYSEYMEEVTRSIEDAAIEKGAMLYRGLDK